MLSRDHHCQRSEETTPTPRVPMYKRMCIYVHVRTYHFWTCMPLQLQSVNQSIFSGGFYAKGKYSKQADGRSANVECTFTNQLCSVYSVGLYTADESRHWRRRARRHLQRAVLSTAPLSFLSLSLSCGSEEQASIGDYGGHPVCLSMSCPCMCSRMFFAYSWRAIRSIA